MSLKTMDDGPVLLHPDGHLKILGGYLEFFMKPALADAHLLLTKELDQHNARKLIDQHKDVLDEAKFDYEKLKKSIDELRTSKIDAEYKLQGMKKIYKGKGYKKRLDDLQRSFAKHLEQYPETRVQVDSGEPQKLEAALTNETLEAANDLTQHLRQ